MFGRDRKRRRRLEAAFGKKPDVYYTDGDMERIRAWSDYRREREDGYSVDDVTWHDLDMDRVFRRIDPGLSTPGEQVLYDTLRHPALTQAEYGRRVRLIAFMEGEPKTRLEVQVILDALGRTRRSDLCTAFAPEARGRGWLAVYAALVAAFAASLVLGALGNLPIVAAIVIMSFNMALREFALRRVRREFDTLNYSVAEVFALRRVQKLGISDLDRELTGAYEALKKLRFVLRTGGVSGMDTGDAGTCWRGRAITSRRSSPSAASCRRRRRKDPSCAWWTRSCGAPTPPSASRRPAILETLFDAGVLCLAATHDLELCALLAGKCRMCHFEQTVGEDSMDFDYRLREGPARSRNAIRLLGMMGFDAALVAQAERRAKRYLETGAWE